LVLIKWCISFCISLHVPHIYTFIEFIACFIITPFYLPTLSVISLSPSASCISQLILYNIPQYKCT
jgi:hypothetical protein